MSDPARLFIPKEAVSELAHKLHDDIYSYKGQLSVAEVLGVLELVKIQLVRDEIY